MTRSPGSGVAAGALVTAVVQSSSATTVSAVGFAGAGLLTFPEALGIVFGPIIAVWTLLVLAVRALRRWSWVGALVCCAMSTVVLVLGLIWLFGAPRVTIEYTIDTWECRSTRSLRAGVFLGTFGALLVSTRGLVEGVWGLLWTVRRRPG